MIPPPHGPNGHRDRRVSTSALVELALTAVAAVFAVASAVVGWVWSLTWLACPLLSLAIGGLALVWWLRHRRLR